MDMESAWLVLLCQSCERAFGKPAGGKNLNCPHCNAIESKVLSRHLNANEASDAVSVANVPPEIRNQLSSWLEKEKKVTETVRDGSIDGAMILSKASNEDGIVTLKSLQGALLSLNIGMNPEAFAEYACAEGELLRDGPNRWKRA